MVRGIEYICWKRKTESVESQSAEEKLQGDLIAAV